MQRTFMTPILVLLGIVGLCALMATTNLFDPLIHYIHSGDITPVQAVICLLFTVGGFAAYYYLLNLICSYFVPRIDEEAESSNTNQGGFDTAIMGKKERNLTTKNEGGLRCHN